MEHLVKQGIVQLGNVHKGLAEKVISSLESRELFLPFMKHSLKAQSSQSLRAIGSADLRKELISQQARRPSVHGLVPTATLAKEKTQMVKLLYRKAN